MMKLIFPCVNYLSDVRERTGTRKYLILIFIELLILNMIYEYLIDKI